MKKVRKALSRGKKIFISLMKIYFLINRKKIKLKIKKKRGNLFNILKYILLFIFGLSITIFISLSIPLNGNESLIYVFFSGALAISAFLLPGVSGSFVLLMLGVYHLIMTSLKSFIEFRDIESLMILSIFSSGIIFGTITISRLLNFLFKK